MEDSQIYELVKKLEPLFHGYTAKERILENSSGMKLHFSSTWNGKTSISGLGGKKRHSIGCSFTKPLDKIAKDIRRRLLPDYRDDYFENIVERKQRQEKIDSDLLKLKALEDATEGEIRDQYGYSSGPYNKYVNSDYANISQRYNGGYELTILADFTETLDIISFLKKSYPYKKKVKEEN